MSDQPRLETVDDEGLAARTRDSATDVANNPDATLEQVKDAVDKLLSIERDGLLSGCKTDDTKADDPLLTKLLEKGNELGGYGPQGTDLGLGGPSTAGLGNLTEASAKGVQVSARIRRLFSGTGLSRSLPARPVPRLSRPEWSWRG